MSILDKINTFRASGKKKASIGWKDLKIGAQLAVGRSIGKQTVSDDDMDHIDPQLVFTIKFRLRVDRSIATLCDCIDLVEGLIYEHVNEDALNPMILSTLPNIIQAVGYTVRHLSRCLLLD